MITISWKCGRCGSDAKANAYRGVVLNNEPEVVQWNEDSPEVMIPRSPRLDLGRLDLNCPNCVGDAAKLRRDLAIARGLALDAQQERRRTREDIVRDIRDTRSALIATEGRTWHWRIVGKSVLSTIDWIIELIEERT